MEEKLENGFSHIFLLQFMIRQYIPGGSKIAENGLMLYMDGPLVILLFPDGSLTTNMYEELNQIATNTQ